MRTPFRFLLAAVLLVALVAAGSVAVATPGRSRAPRGAAAGQATGVTAARKAPHARPAKAGSPVAGRDFVPGRMLVGFRSGVSSASRSAALRAVGARPGATVGRRGQLALVSGGADVPALAGRLAARPGVAFAEPDWIRHTNACDPSVCWYLDTAGVNAFPVHTAGRKGAGSTVAVIDTGVAPISELGSRVTGRWTCNPTCVVDGGSPDPVTFSHGTEVASLVAAEDDADGITGVAPEADIKAFKVDDPSGGLPISALISALNVIAGDASIDVVNMSLGGLESSTGEENAIAGALAAGKTIVAAAGNDGNYYPSYPAAYPGVLSVGASAENRTVAFFSSYGKVDVAAPGLQVPAITPAGGISLVDGTSFASPIVAGVIALRPTTGSDRQLRAKLAVEGTATAGSGGQDVKKFGHGIASASGYVASHDGGAYLVLDSSGPDPGPAIYSTSGQLPNPTTTFDAYALKTDGSLGAAPGVSASFTVDSNPLVATRPFASVATGVFKASSGVQTLARDGTRVGAASVDGSSESDSMPVRVLRANDQAPGVPLSGSGDAAWTQAGTLVGSQSADDDADDVYAVFLSAGDTLDSGIFRPSGADLPVALLYAPGTTDVLSQFDQVVACTDADPSPDCPSSLHYRAPVSGTYLVDVFTVSANEQNPYHLTWAASGSSALPISVGVAACSPNGDGRQDLCAWTAGALSGRTITSYVTRSFSGIRVFSGAGAKTWNGTNDSSAAQPDGTYALRVLYAQGGVGGRKLLRVFPLILNRARPVVGNLVVAPNPFEPVPKDGDRDTTTFAINSNERSRLRVLVYKSGTTTLVRTITTGFLAAGRQRVSWNGKTLAGTQLRGTFAWRMEIIDPAGNLYQTGRYSVRIL